MVADYGCEPRKRSMVALLDSGIVIVDKPPGPTSHQVSEYVKQIFGVPKAGHAGSLDPKVTGVLPVALGRATRIVQALLPAPKAYVAVMHFHKDVRDVEAVIAPFRGRITQTPPLRSAVKRQARQRTIYELNVLEVKDKDVLFAVRCEAGTYIRKLIHDIGRDVGGAHMAELRRTKAGPFKEENAHSLHELLDAYKLFEQGEEGPLRQLVRPFEDAVVGPKVVVANSAVESVCQGASLAAPGVLEKESFVAGDGVALMTVKGELIGLGKAAVDSDKVKKSGVVVLSHKVFMKRGTYPKVY